MIYSKPNYGGLGTWAFNGNIVSPTSEKIETGWVIEKPKNEVMNWVQNRQDTAIAYLFQNGVAEWDEQTEFAATGYTRYNGVMYQAISQNIDKRPDIETGIWRVAFTSYSDYLNLQDEINKIKNQDGYLSLYVRKAAPEMTGKCYGTAYTANVGVITTGTDNVGYGFNTKLTDGLFHTGDAPVIQKNGEIVAIFEPPLSTSESSKRVATMDVLQDRLQFYKVGDLYLTISNEDPAVRLGYGSWQPFAQGQALVGVADPNADTPAWTKYTQSVFGAYDVGLTADQNGPHDHGISVRGQNGLEAGSQGNDLTTDGITVINLQTGVSGRGLPHNNVQPSITVRIWLRTA